MRTLVVGCDASGKSTMVDAIKECYADAALESTSTGESRKFKYTNLDRPVDFEFIDQREQLYLKLSKEVLQRLATSDILNYVSTDATLVTRLSHNVMRRCIGGESVSFDKTVDEWIKDETAFGVSQPDLLVLTHVPFDVTLSRIKQRQEQGNKDENFWGFNAPFFLQSYHNAWQETKDHIENIGIKVVSLDTSVLSPEDALKQYSHARDTITDV